MSEQTPGQKREILPIAIVGIILAALCGISLYIRIALPYDQIFIGDWVWFRETDAYYYIRNIENLVHNFPHFNPFDPYVLYPGGGMGLTHPFFGWIVAGVILIFKGASSSLHSMEVVAAYMPAIIGTLTIIPVYFIGKELFSRWAGVISAALIVILPSEFLHRSLLGFSDHHAAEVLFSSVSILFLIMAIKRARERELSFSHVLNRDWATITKPLIYSLLAGIFLGVYMLTWRGGLMFAFIIFAYLVIQFVIDHLRHKSCDYLAIVSTPIFLLAFLMLLSLSISGSLERLSIIALLIAILVPIVLSIISRLMASRSLRPAYYPMTLLGLIAIGLVLLRVINPSLFKSIFSLFSIFTPTGAALTVLEVQPLTLAIGWSNFNTSFVIAFISLAMLIYFIIKEKSADKVLFLVWSIIMLMAVLGQRRFGYYYAVNVALLTGYFSWKMLDIAGLRKLLAKPKEAVEAVRKFKKREKKTREKAKPKTFMQPRGAWVWVIIVGIVIFFVVFFPNISHAERLGTQPNYIMNDGWYNACLWLKDNSPEPFDDPDFYYELYPPRDEFEYPETAYGVMSWWDYGYFIMQIAHRLPNANPTQARAREAGQFFTAQNESSANELADKYSTKYVMIDNAMPSGKFYAMVEWAGTRKEQFFETYYYYLEQANQIMPVPLAYPAYYHSMVTRLYIFDGNAQPGNDTLVISYQDGEDTEGRSYKLISSAKLFSNYTDAETFISSHEMTDYNIMGVFPTGNVVVAYEERVSEEGIDYEELTAFIFFPEPYYDCEDAQAFILDQQTGNYKILDPFVSPVPLEKLERYELINSSDSLYTFATLCKKLPSVKTFEYLGPDES